MSKNTEYIVKVNSVLKGVDFKKLDKSCNGDDKSYAKAILGKLHKELVNVYGTDYFDWSAGDFVDLPAVIKGQNSGHVSLGLVTLDLQSSGEHFGTNIFTSVGVIDHGDDAITVGAKQFLNRMYIPYDYWYTPFVQGDHHVDFDHIPSDVREIMSGFIDIVKPNVGGIQDGTESHVDEQAARQ